MSRGPVKVVRYNTSWPMMYKEYASSIVKHLSSHMNKIAHIGSTSIEGLGAKPIIDICVTVDNIDHPDIIKEMEGLGYKQVEEDDEEFPFRRYFVLKSENKHLVHVHFVPVDHQYFIKHVIFRDYLRTHKDVRDEYHLLKTRLANRFKDDRRGYQKGKTKFIESVIKMAEEESSKS